MNKEKNWKPIHLLDRPTMCGVALPEPPVEAFNVANHASDVRETWMPAERSVSEHPEIIIDVIVCILHFVLV